MTAPPAVLARAAYLRAAGAAWDDIAGKLAVSATDAEALAGHPEWPRFYRLAARTVAREAEADARRELRFALRSLDDAEATAAAEEAYRRHFDRPRAAKPAPASAREQLARAYLECLNDMTAEDYLALVREPETDSDPGANVTVE